jgi:hypothetical protein
VFPARGKVRRHQSIERDFLKFAKILFRDLQLVEQCLGGKRCVIVRDYSYRRTALNHCTVEQTPGSRHREKRPYFPASARFPEDHDATWIAAEVLNVIADPFQRLNDIEHADIARVRELFASQVAEKGEAQCVESMIDRDDYHVPALAQVGSIVTLRRA